MNLVKQLDEDLITAMKAHDSECLAVIREIKGNVKLANIDQKKEINDELVIDMVSRGIKTRKESIESFKAGNRRDLIDKTESEIEILNKYLPEQLSSDEVNAVIDEIFDSVKPESMKDMGKVMASATAKLKGKADMASVSKIIKEKLGA